jgi:hypothetical protein
MLASFGQEQSTSSEPNNPSLAILSSWNRGYDCTTFRTVATPALRFVAKAISRGKTS